MEKKVRALKQNPTLPHKKTANLSPAPGPRREMGQ